MRCFMLLIVLCIKILIISLTVMVDIYALLHDLSNILFWLNKILLLE